MFQNTRLARWLVLGSVCTAISVIYILDSIEESLPNEVKSLTEEAQIQNLANKVGVKVTFRCAVNAHLYPEVCAPLSEPLNAVQLHAALEDVDECTLTRLKEDWLNQSLPITVAAVVSTQRACAAAEVKETTRQHTEAVKKEQRQYFDSIRD